VSEAEPEAALTALLALARSGGRDAQKDLLYALESLPLGSLTEPQQLTKLRILQVSFARDGKPIAPLARRVLAGLDGHFPAASEPVNRELVQLLVYLEAPGVVERALALLDRAQTQEEQVHYIFHLRNVKSGWTLDQRRKYFDWFTKARQKGTDQVTYPAGSPYSVWTNQTHASKVHPPQLVQWFKDVGRDYGDGASYPKYLVNIRKDAAANLTSAERLALGPLLEGNISAPEWKPTQERKFVKEWTMADLEASLDAVASGRDFKSGQAAFNDAQCISCHRFGNEGGSVGPELTGVGSKYSRRDILESLLEPSKVVSDQYQNTTLLKRDGDDVTGRIVDENAERVVVLPNMLAPELTIAVPLSEIAKREASKISPMPTGLLNNLTKEEILDLLAYMESAGKSGAANFRRPVAAGR
jgi:putative heme-binding domain-containing protein